MQSIVSDNVSGAQGASECSTADFLRRIAPPDGNGYYCVAVFENGLKRPPKHSFFPTVEETAKFCLDADSKGANVFHACATYETPERRTQANSKAMRSFWLDLDVKEGQYESRRDAAAAITQFCADISLPQPMLVNSGRGLHCYWPLIEPISSLLWRRIADALAAVLGAKGMKYDPTRTADQASILRPVGTHHRKSDPLPVRLLRDCEPLAFEAVSAPLMAAISALGILPPKVYADAPKPALSSGLEQSYPPSSGAACADKCPAMAAMRDTEGDVEFPVWRNVIGILKHCTDGRDLAEAWTEERAANHDKADWQYQWHTWTSGPTTCEYMAKSFDGCATCPWQGRVTSPIMLGYPEPIVQAPRSGDFLPTSGEARSFDGLTADQAIDRLNETTCLVRLGTKYMACDFRTPVLHSGGVQYTRGFLEPSALRTKLNGIVVKYHGRDVPLANVWLNDRRRRTYEGVGFDPGGRLVSDRRNPAISESA